MGDVGTVVRTALESFLSADSQQQGRRLRQLSEATPQVFAAVACALLRDVKDTQNYRYLLALLNSRGLLIHVLQMLSAQDPGAAGTATNLAMRLVPGFDRLLVRGQEPPLSGQYGDDVDKAELLQGVLQTVDCSLQLLASVEAELRVRDPRVRSRMSMLAGRVARLWEQFGHLQEDPDPRVRANAVESLWGTSTPMSAQVFESALGDTHHRVRANALVGLYLQGNAGSLKGLRTMGGDPDPIVRAAAAWAMGRTGDTRFEPQLQEMRRSTDRNPMVIRNALLSISRLQRAAAASPHHPLELSLLSSSFSIRSGLLDIQVEIQSGQPLAALQATHVQVWSEDSPVWDYHLKRIGSECRPLTIVLPINPESADTDVQSWAQTTDSVLKYKGEEQLWALSGYATQAAAGNYNLTGTILHLSDSENLDPDSLRFDLPEFRETEEEIREDAIALAQGASAAQGPFRLAAKQAGRHNGHDLLLVIPPLPPALANARWIEELRRSAQERDVRVHAVIDERGQPGLASQVQSLCQSTGGWHHTRGNGQDLHRSLHTLVSALSSHWQIEFEEPQQFTNIEIRIRTGKYSGEITAARPATDKAA